MNPIINHLRFVWRRRLLMGLVGTLCLLMGCTSTPCGDLPTQFSSPDAALDQVRAASFPVVCATETEKSSWIESAEFLSCDGREGFFIFRTEDRTYLHQAVPKAVWDEFSKAPSKGAAYHQLLKDRYQIETD